MENRNEFLDNIYKFYHKNYIDISADKEIKYKIYFSKYPVIKEAFEQLKIDDIIEALKSEFNYQVKDDSLSLATYYKKRFGYILEHFDSIQFKENTTTDSFLNKYYNKRKQCENDEIEYKIRAEAFLFTYLKEFTELIRYFLSRFEGILTIFTFDKDSGLNYNFNSDNDKVNGFYNRCLYEGAYWSNYFSFNNGEISPAGIKERIESFFTEPKLNPYKERFIKKLKSNLLLENKKNESLFEPNGAVFKTYYNKTKEVIDYLQNEIDKLNRTLEPQKLENIESNNNPLKDYHNFYWIYEAFFENCKNHIDKIDKIKRHCNDLEKEKIYDVFHRAKLEIEKLTFTNNPNADRLINSVKIDITKLISDYDKIITDNKLNHVDIMPKYQSFFKTAQWFCDFYDWFYTKIDINKALPPQQPETKVELEQESENDFTLSTIEDWLFEFKELMTEQDYKTLVSALIHYFDNGTFPVLKKAIQINGRPNKKLFGWALNRIFEAKSKGIERELLLFANKNISLFTNVKFDENNILKSNLYKYFTTQTK